jgi:hypothetical protein
VQLGAVDSRKGGTEASPGNAPRYLQEYRACTSDCKRALATAKSLIQRIAQRRSCRSTPLCYGQSSPFGTSLMASNARISHNICAVVRGSSASYWDRVSWGRRGGPSIRLGQIFGGISKEGMFGPKRRLDWMAQSVGFSTCYHATSPTQMHPVQVKLTSLSIGCPLAKCSGPSNWHGPCTLIPNGHFVSQKESLQVGGRYVTLRYQ